MGQGHRYAFQDFVLDIANATLHHGQTLCALRPKALAMLHYFVARPGQLISKDELFAVLWPNIVVDNATLTGCVRELRAVLHDDARQPRFIETISKRGYRFIPKVVSPQLSVVSEEERQKAEDKWQIAKRLSQIPDAGLRTPDFSAPVFVGRDAELMHLHSLLAKAANGERQVVFVTDEAGIGKTALVENFLFGVRSHEKFGMQNLSLHLQNSNYPKLQTPNCLQLPTPSSRVASASNNTGLRKPTCRSSKPCATCVQEQRVSTSLPCYASMRRRGRCKCPACCLQQNSTPYSHGLPAPHASACCRSLLRRLLVMKIASPISGATSRSSNG
jgi:DNA-binding winged helix-turn-helix (wHTH) protein